MVNGLEILIGIFRIGKRIFVIKVLAVVVVRGLICFRKVSNIDIIWNYIDMGVRKGINLYTV